LIDRNWGSVVLPAMLIIITAAAINLLGDWLQDRFEQRAVQR
jgi:ABC-type dipeptide/oligopeptide/nickel transport system permease subunit